MGAVGRLLAPIGMRMAHIHLKTEHGFERLRAGYLALLAVVLRRRPLVLLVFVLVLVSAAFITPWVGQDFFPQVDAGQIRLHVNAPPGTRIEDTGIIFSQVQDEMRRVIAKEDLDVIIDNIGVPPSTNLAYSDSVTLSSADGEILASLKPGHRISTAEYIKRLREILPAKCPDCTFYFQPADMMNQILNFGLPAPIDIKVIGEDSRTTRSPSRSQPGFRTCPAQSTCTCTRS